MFPCPYCDKLFETVAGVKRHVNRIHLHKEWREDKYYKCPICGKKVRNLQLHAMHKSLKDEDHAILFFFTADRLQVPSKKGDMIYKMGMKYYVSKYCPEKACEVFICSFDVESLKESLKGCKSKEQR